MYGLEYTDLHTPNCLYSVPHTRLFSFAIPTQSEGVYPVPEMRIASSPLFFMRIVLILGCTTPSPEFFNDTDSQQLAMTFVLDPKIPLQNNDLDSIIIRTT